jgi:alpha-tubulin suppressor-like RCC1 family protein
MSVSCGGAHNLALSEVSNGTCVWSWGSGTYGQLGHRDTWDTLFPQSIDEIRMERIRYIDAGERHSLAVSENSELWVWGNGVHGDFEVKKPEFGTTSIVYPVKVSVTNAQFTYCMCSTLTWLSL